MRIPTIAVLTGPQPVDGDGLLRAELSALGATVVDADGPAAAARAVASASAAGRVALVDRRLIAHRHALRLAIEDPRWVAAHSVGVLTVSGQARELLATRLRTLPDLTAHRVEGASPAAKLTAPRPLVCTSSTEPRPSRFGRLARKDRNLARIFAGLISAASSAQQGSCCMRGPSAPTRSSPPCLRTARRARATTPRPSCPLPTGNRRD